MSRFSSSLFLTAATISAPNFASAAPVYDSRLGAEIVRMARGESAGKLAFDAQNRWVLAYGAGRAQSVKLSRFSPDGVLDGTWNHAGIGNATFSAGFSVSQLVPTWDKKGYFVSGETPGWQPLRCVARVDERGYAALGFTNLPANTQYPYGDVMSGEGLVANAAGRGGLIPLPDGGVFLSDVFRVPGVGGIYRENVELRQLTATGADNAIWNRGVKLDYNFPQVKTDSRFYNALLGRQSDGKIVVASSVYSDYFYRNCRFVVTRFHPNGTRDLSFGVNGWFVSEMEFASAAFAMAVMPDDRLVLAGNSEWQGENYKSENAFYGLTKNGAIDPTFGNGGRKFWKDLVPVAATPLHLKLDKKGRLIFAATSQKDLVVGRLLANGALDRTFRGTGFCRTPVVNSTDYSRFSLVGFDSDYLNRLGVSLSRGPSYNSSVVSYHLLLRYADTASNSRPIRLAAPSGANS